MKIEGWRYYNHAALPAVPPHVQADIRPIQDHTIWKISDSCYLARWITDFDCQRETNWWYLIKDTPFDIEALKAKRRYEINKGKRNYEILEIDPKKYKADIYEIQTLAYAEYPEKYRPTINKTTLFEEIDEWSYYKLYGAFSAENHSLDGYAWLNRDGRYIYYAFQKVKPEAEKLGINAALVAAVLEAHHDELDNGCYICDGSRSIQHETHFQDYLEKYFEFRKAYCVLHIAYRKPVRLLVTILYCFRKFLRKLDNIPLIHDVNGLLKMEELVRTQNAGEKETL